MASLKDAAGVSRPLSPDAKQGVPAAQPSQPTGWRAVSSSNLANVAYDYATRELRIQFRNNSMYAYQDVPAETYEALLGAGSKGRYFADNIKGRYQYARVG